MPMKLTDTHLVLLSAAAQRPDLTVVAGPNLKVGTAAKIVGKLLRERLLEEVPANGSLPAWRRDDDKGCSRYVSPTTALQRSAFRLSKDKLPRPRKRQM
jgi:hypothetical protein